MILVIFDIDGTLTNTNKIDYDCWTRAFTDCFGVDLNGIKWTDYPEFTDLALLHAVYLNYLKKPISPIDILLFRKKFLAEFKQELGRNPGAFLPVNGASEFLKLLSKDKQITVAIATGGFSDTARLKLDAAGIDSENLAFAASDRWMTRVEIMKDAVRQAKYTYNMAPFERVVCLGDSAFDVSAANTLTYPIIGIDCENQQNFDLSKVLGVHTDYSDKENLLALIQG